MNSANNSDLHEAGEMIVNAQADKATPYSDYQSGILSDTTLSEAAQTISAWPGYGAYGLHALPDIAGQGRVAVIRYKDESGRFGLGSFKALGGAYAVARLLRQRIGQTQYVPQPATEKVLSSAHSDVTKGVTVYCATDGNHGRSVAWDARTFGCQCKIFIHAKVGESRKQAFEAYGAEVMRINGNYHNFERNAQRIADKNSWFMVSKTSYPGYTEIPTCVLQEYEVMAQEADDALAASPTHVFIQTRGDGLAAFQSVAGDTDPALYTELVRRGGEDAREEAFV